MRKVVYLAVVAATLLPTLAASAETPAEKRVAQQIGSHLKQSGQLQNYRVGVKYHDGVAILAGTVSSPEQRDIALHLAQQCEGVKQVVCKLECPTDHAIQSSNFGNEPIAAQHEGGNINNLNAASYEEPQNDASSPMLPPDPAISQQAMQPMALAQQTPRIAAQPARRSNMPVPYQRMPGTLGMQNMGPPRQPGPNGVCQASCNCNAGGPGPGAGMMMGGGEGGGAPAGFVPGGSGRGPSYDQPQMPGYAWPSYASYPNYAALSYPQQYSPSAWPYIGPFYPYPQVPLAWRKVSLEWDDGWWFLDFSSHNSSH
ncbi:MAG TPA: BON domain-containing protein [Lacipirellulaceae bacterium]|jgi:hypothetical protein|nr:BON domain-containing protein [Lacipirellulaceae bacterium]